MDLSKIDPELHKPLKRIPNVPVGNRFLVAFARFALNLTPKRKSGNGVQISETRLGPAAVRLYRPDTPKSEAALLWIHGGGLIFGNAAINDDLCLSYARDLGLTVASVEYRLAPKHRFPAAYDDCLTVWNWLQSNADILGIDPARIVVSGQSAGGGLAAALVQRVHDLGGVQPVGQVLFCPMLDDRTAADQTLDTTNHRVWNNRANRYGWGAYLGKDPGVDSVPDYAVPARRDDLTGLPPTWIGIGDVDLFYGESCAYAERLNASGVPCDLHIAPGGAHGFEHWAPKSALTRAFMADNIRFLRKVLDLPEQI